VAEGDDLVRTRLEEHAALAADLLSPALVAGVAEVGAALVTTFRQGGKLLLMGNGGSAADAQHIAAEFVGRCTRERGALPAIALADSAASMTAVANDYGYEQVFARHVEAFGRPGDLVLGLSTSGRSPNVLLGLERARSLGMQTVALCGAEDGQMRAAAGSCLAVPSVSPARIQEAHLVWGHIWAEAVETRMH
jgi:D-sedoheptulose 7-phosphate isomerase